jgi:uncharacterized protein with HEPN domain
MTAISDPADSLNDILENILKIESFTADIDFANFEADDMRAYATIRALEIIGEAVKQVPQDIRDQYPDIPWRSVARMRDKLIHHYFGVDLAVVWNTVKHDIPPLKKTVKQILSGNAQK